MIVAVVIVACSRVPKNIIGQDKMASLTADMLLAESVIDMDRNNFQNDSSKKVLKQSIFAKYDVTQADFDTSMVWYGQNLDVYLKVYDKALKILEDKNSKLGTEIVQTAMSIAGDSVDVWSGARYARINTLLPSRFVRFDMKSDENWAPGDVYTWRVKIIGDETKDVHYTIVATYADNTTDWLQTKSTSKDWNEVTFASDSTRTLTSLKGYFEIQDAQHGFGENEGKSAGVPKTIWVDSISLIRKRSSSVQGNQRYNLRNYPIY